MILQENRITAKNFWNPIALPDDILERANADPDSILKTERDRIKFKTASEQISAGKKEMAERLAEQQARQKLMAEGENFLQGILGQAPTQEMKF